ncbi:MAG: MFS transporter [Gordonia polyisoprenivorans]|nr:MFS transporter [Gordonia polyisoprenivorans]
MTTTTTPRPAPVDTQPWTRYAAMAAVLFTVIAGTNIPSPLYKQYAHQWGFSPTVLTLLFSTYAAVLVVALLTASRVTGRLGYRVSLIGALSIAALASAVFALASNTAWLFLARGLQGAAVGIASGALTATIVALHPKSDGHSASAVVTAMTAFGGGLGPVICGVFAQFLPAPLHTIYWVEAALLILGVLVVATIPPYLGKSTTGPATARPALPTTEPTSFLTAAAGTFLAWGVVALFLTIAPSLIADLTGDTHVLTAGIVAGVVLIASGIAQITLARLDTHRATIGGLVLLALGLAGLIGATFLAQPAAVIAAAIIAGVGHGLTFMAALRTTNALTENSDRRPRVLSSFYIATYGGVGIPVIGAGIVATATDTTFAVRIFAVVTIIALVALLTAVTTIRRTQRAQHD